MMTLPDSLRWYGWAAVLGGVLFAASDFAARLLVAVLDGGGDATGGYALWITLSLLALALLQLALVGLYSPHQETAGTVGWVGFFLAFTGIAFALFIVLVYAVAASPLPLDAPELLKAGPPAMFLLYFPLFSAGWVLLGAGFVRVPFYSRWAVRLLGFGAVIALHPNPPTTAVFDAGVVWMGLALVPGDAFPADQPRRPHLRGGSPRIMRHEGERVLDAPAYFLVGRRVGKGTGERLTLLSHRTSDGERAVLAFEEATAAEAFRVIEGLGPEWEVTGALQEVMGILRSAARGELRYVALDPPSTLRREHEEPRLVPIVAFVDQLMGR
jgi:hypothetical protein